MEGSLVIITVIPMCILKTGNCLLLVVGKGKSGGAVISERQESGLKKDTDS